MSRIAVRFADHQDRTLDGAGLKKLLAFALKHLGLAGPVSLAVVDDARIAELNRRFKGRDESTDVLAFALSGDPDPDPELGEIVVSADTAARQAAERGHALDEEMAVLALHGLLHLAGMDDADRASRVAMLKKGGEILDAFRAAARPRAPGRRGSR